MLQTLHNKAAGFFVKLLMGLLVASFALWGIGDIFRSSPNSAVVVVGNSAVTAQELQTALEQEAANYRRMLGEQYSTELLKSIGVPAQVLNKLIQQHLIEEEVRALGLAAPDSYLMTELRNTPAFYGEDGKFDAQRFRVVLGTNNLSEARYLELLGKEMTADMLLQSAFSGVRATESAAELAYMYENEKRTADLLIFSPELVQQINDPSDMELARFHEENAGNFKAPEQRVISMVALDVQDMLEGMAVSDDDLLIEYQDRIEEFRDPEKREVRQLLFNDEQSARQAAAALNQGMSLEDAAKEFGATNPTLLLGTVTASGVLPEAEEQVFSLAEGEHTAPVQSSFGWHIFQVTEIMPERTRPLAEVKEQLTEDIRTQRVGTEAFELSNTLQDDLAGGASLEEAAQSIGVEVQTFGPLSEDGTAPDGTEVNLPEGYPNLLPTAFDLAEGGVSNLMETDGGSYYAIRVDSVIPERTRALDEIRGLVIEEWKMRQKEKRLYQLASGIASTLSDEDVSEVAQKTGAQLLQNQEFTRGSTQFGNSRPLPSMMLTTLFSAQEDAATEAFALPDGSYVVAKLTDIQMADTNDEEVLDALESAQENLRAVYGDELYLQYMAYLRSKHGVSEPDQDLINSLLQ